MSSTTAYVRLRRLGGTVLTTREAAAALRTSSSAASRSLRRLSEQGLVTRVAHGLWSLSGEPLDPRVLAPEITRPFPSYVSFASALAAHQVIDQIPREIALASLGRPKRVRTSVGRFVVHRLPPPLFGGFARQGVIQLATPEKALFDFYYVAMASSRVRRRLPELDIPRSFSHREIERWIERIASPRLRTLVRHAVDDALKHAERG